MIAIIFHYIQFSIEIFLLLNPILLPIVIVYFVFTLCVCIDRYGVLHGLSLRLRECFVCDLSVYFIIIFIGIDICSFIHYKAHHSFRISFLFVFRCTFSKEYRIDLSSNTNEY